MRSHHFILLIIEPTYGRVNVMDFARECGLSLSQLDPFAPEIEGAAVEFQYVKGGPMVSPKLHPSRLQTQLRKLNKWYLDVAKEG